VLSQQQLLHLLDGALHRCELQQDLDARLIFRQHSLDALNLSLDPTKSAEGSGLRVRLTCATAPAAARTPHRGSAPRRQAGGNTRPRRNAGRWLIETMDTLPG
jgi:hypothetical protein